MHNPAPYEAILYHVFGKKINLKSYRIISSGNLSQAMHLETVKGSFFLKTNSGAPSDIFEKECNGLDFLRQNTFLQVPLSYGYGKIEAINYLLLEWIPKGKIGEKYWEELAQGLAELHRNTATEFGLKEDNYIAVLPQINKPCDLWTEFFIENRIEKMLTRAFYKKLVDNAFVKKFRKIYTRISSLFPNEKPALIHGDLWAGNVMSNAKNMPAIIDPAVYFGMREMDLAFSKLFGGFHNRFYAAYEEVFPTVPGLEDRVEVYNLYPLLVHLNLFGKSYLAGIKETVNRYAG